MSEKPLLITIPHSGEKIPDLCVWLQNLPEEILMCDVDRYIDQLYLPVLEELKLHYIKTDWHRYAADLNRIPTDIDRDSVEGSAGKSGSFSRGFHWVMTTYEHILMSKPMTVELHQKLVDLIYTPFHKLIAQKVSLMKEKELFHLDLHSMPSLGTKQHRDPGELRADIVVSDSLGKSSRPEFVDLVIKSYVRAGFKVGYNWPYTGGRLTEQYGQPDQKHHCVQVELNRSLYMDEKTKKWIPEKAEVTKLKLADAIRMIEAKL